MKRSLTWILHTKLELKDVKTSGLTPGGRLQCSSSHLPLTSQNRRILIAVHFCEKTTTSVQLEWNRIITKLFWSSSVCLIKYSNAPSFAAGSSCSSRFALFVCYTHWNNKENSHGAKFSCLKELSRRLWDCSQFYTTSYLSFYRISQKKKKKTLQF